MTNSPAIIFPTATHPFEPFSMTTVCPKCGCAGEPAHLKYERRDYIFLESHGWPAEWIRRTCVKCSFVWFQMTKDQSQTGGRQ